MTVSDAPSCCVTYDHHSDNAKGLSFRISIYLYYRPQNEYIVFLFYVRVANISCMNVLYIVPRGSKDAYNRSLGLLG
jgi:hypothetical protein